MATIKNGKVEYQGGEALPAVGSEEYKMAQQGQLPTTEPATITADALAPVPEVKLPEPVPETAPQEIINTATAQSEVQKIADQAKTEKTAATSDISKLLSDIGVVQGRENAYATQAGADEARRLSDTYQSSIDIESRALKNYTDNLYKDPNLTTTLVNRLANEQTRKSASTIADLSVAKAVVDRDYDRAISIAEKKVEAELAPLKADLEAKKFIFDANIDLWTAGEKSILDNIIKKEERAYDEQVKTKNDIEALKIEARKNGAPDSVINAMAKATTLDEALLAAGNYSSDPLDRAIKQAQLAKLRADISSISANSPVSDKVQGAQNLKVLINELATMKGQGGAVGVSLQKLIPNILKGKKDFVAGTPAANYQAAYNQLKDSLAFENISKLKGAMSDKDIEFLRNIGTKLTLGMSEEAFNAELEKLDLKMNEVLVANGVDVSQISPFNSLSDEELLSIPSTTVDNNSFFNK